VSEIEALPRALYKKAPASAGILPLYCPKSSMSHEVVVIDLADSDDDDEEPLAFTTESRVPSMSSIAMDSAVLCYGDSPLVNALRALANSEKSRAEHAHAHSNAQQPFNCRGGGGGG
jgi:hypothetical protein